MNPELTMPPFLDENVLEPAPLVFKTVATVPVDESLAGICERAIRKRNQLYSLSRSKERAFFGLKQSFEIGK